MAAPGQNVLVVNVLYWIVGALLYPLASLFPAGSGETPKIFSLLIPLIFLMLAFGSTTLLARVIKRQEKP